MIHKGTKELQTERLILRKFSIDDAQEMFDRYSGIPKMVTAVFY